MIFAIGFFLGKYQLSIYQNRGEALLSQAIKSNFAPPDYHLMNHVTLALKSGTTQVDHILISRFGIFVIETKDYKGWIFANAKQPIWTQVIFKQKFKFQNPIFQNFKHVKAIQALLDFLPPDVVRSAVVFTGEAEFKTDVPTGVYDLPKFIEHLRNNTSQVMSLNRLQFCVGRIETTRLAVSGETDLEHIQSLERRNGKRN